MERSQALSEPIGPSKYWPILLLISIGLFHRLFLFGYYFDDISLMVSNHPSWLTWQYLTIPALRDNLLDSMLYLQQTPPLPQLFLALCLKFLSWPTQVSYFLILVNGLISIVSALLLYLLSIRLTKMIKLSFGLALLFLLNADLVVIEYNSLGQTIYENICMIWILMFVMGGSQLAEGNSVRGTVLMSVSTALLIMTRSAYTYFFIVPLILLLVTRPAPFKKCLGIFLAVWMSTHGAWVIKNYVVYDTFSLSTSTWQGANLAKGLVSTGFEHAFRENIIRNDFGAPDWFVDHIKSEPNIPLWGAGARDFLPRSVIQKSKDIDDRLKGTNRWENSVAVAEYVKHFEPAYIDFAIDYPSAIVSKVSRSYEKFWVPIRYYGGMYLSLFKVDWVVKRSLDVSKISRHWLSGQLPENQWILVGKYPDFHTKSATMFTIDILSPLMAILSLVAIHLFLPYQCIKEGWLLVRNKKLTARSLTYLSLALTIGYSFFVFVFVEHGENMRFRLSIEPIIWLCIVLMLAAGIATATRRLARTKLENSSHEIT